MLPPLLPCCSLDNPGWQLQNQPFLFYIFFCFHPCLPRFPHGVYNYCAVSRAFSPPFRPTQSYSRSRYRRPRSYPVFDYGSPPPSPSPLPPRPRSRPRSRPALLRSLPPPFPFPLRPRPHDRSHPRHRLRSHPRLQSRPRPRSLLPAPRTRFPPPVTVSVPTPDSNPAPDPVRSFLPLGPGYPPGTMRLYRRRALRIGLSGARKRHSLSAEMVTRAE